MIRVVYLQIMFFIMAAGYSQSFSLDEIRQQFFEGWEGSCGAQSLADKLSVIETEGDPVFLAYRGAAESTLANCEFFPWNKLKQFNKGREQIEKAVKLNPENYEIRFIRFTVQSNIPGILDYNNLDEDKKFILKSLTLQLCQSNPHDFCYTIMPILINSDLLTQKEKEKLSKLMAERLKNG